jgi:hypothetical protein
MGDGTASSEAGEGGAIGEHGDSVGSGRESGHAGEEARGDDGGVSSLSAMVMVALWHEG